MQEAVKFLTELREKLRNSGSTSCQNKLDSAEQHAVRLKLVEMPPFSALKGGWLPAFGVQSWDIGAEWSIKRLIGGMEPADIVNLAAKEIEQNSVVLSEVSNIRGVIIGNIERISENSWIYPDHAIPEHFYQERPATERLYNQHSRNESAALVIKYDVSPAVIWPESEKDIEKIFKINRILSEERDDFRANVKRALLLSSTGEVDIFTRYIINEENNILVGKDELLSKISRPYSGPPHSIEVSDFRLFLEKLQNFRKPESLWLAIDRMARSRINIDAEDKAIDLGMALEVALMHNDPSPNQEINNKLGTRAGWLLGSTVAERKIAKRDASHLYSARSDAVHRGYITEKTLKNYNYSDANLFVQKILLSILQRGGFPDWSDLIFGGTNSS